MEYIENDQIYFVKLPSSYVAINSRSKSSFSSKLYIIFLVFGPRHVIVFESGDGGGVEHIDAHEPYAVQMI